MNRRGAISFGIIILFIAGCYYAVKPLAAEIFASRGAYETALSLDPLNAKYHDAIGRKYLNKGRAGRDKAALRSAKEIYAKAIALSPANSAYRLGWGEAEGLLLLDKSNISEGELAAYVDNFKKAIELAPNNYYVNTTAGYYILLFRDRISARDKNFAIYRLMVALELNPRYANYVFSYVANGLGDFSLLHKITPNTSKWHKALNDFLRNIDKWKYRK
jgi:hypothetical protein